MCWTLIQKLFKNQYEGHDKAAYRSMIKGYLKTFALVMAGDLMATLPCAPVRWRRKPNTTANSCGRRGASWSTGGGP